MIISKVWGKGIVIAMIFLKLQKQKREVLKITL